MRTNRIALAIVCALTTSKISESAKPPCPLSTAVVVWNSVTPRDYSVYMRALDARATLPGKAGRKFDPSAIRSGRVSVCSLGEGNSNFIWTLKDEASSVVAVDVAYAEASPSWEQLTEATKTRVQSNPDLYIPSSFQELNLTQGGQRRRFDEIVSSNAVMYVLNTYLRKGNPEGAKMVLRNIRAHLKDEGIFTAWAIPDENMRPALESIIRDLIEEGTFSSRWGPGPMPGGDFRSLLVLVP